VKTLLGEVPEFTLLNVAEVYCGTTKVSAVAATANEGTIMEITPKKTYARLGISPILVFFIVPIPAIFL